jgi:hypothetical protein
MQTYEKVLPRRVICQPVPFVQQGGDCGACVRGGLLGVGTVNEVYEQYMDGKAASFHWASMRDALYRAESRGLIDRMISDVPVWPWRIHEPFCEWGFHAGFMSLAWFRYVTMAIDAGYYGLALVDINKKGPFGGGTDHWVMICGARMRRREVEGGACFDDEILVSCSSTRTPDEEWVDAGKFLIERGGFNLLLARPITAA